MEEKSLILSFARSVGKQYKVQSKILSKVKREEDSQMICSGLAELLVTGCAESPQFMGSDETENFVQALFVHPSQDTVSTV